MSGADDSWLSTRNKSKIPSKPVSLKRRSSLVKPKRPQNSIISMTQNSPPPKELFTAKKQSKLNDFFKAKDSDIQGKSNSCLNDPENDVVFPEIYSRIKYGELRDSNLDGVRDPKRDSIIDKRRLAVDNYNGQFEDFVPVKCSERGQGIKRLFCDEKEFERNDRKKVKRELHDVDKLETSDGPKLKDQTAGKMLNEDRKYRNNSLKKHRDNGETLNSDSEFKDKGSEENCQTNTEVTTKSKNEKSLADSKLKCKTNTEVHVNCELEKSSTHSKLQGGIDNESIETDSLSQCSLDLSKDDTSPAEDLVLESQIVDNHTEFYTSTLDCGTELDLNEMAEEHQSFQLDTQFTLSSQL